MPVCYAFGAAKNFFRSHCTVGPSTRSCSIAVRTRPCSCSQRRHLGPELPEPAVVLRRLGAGRGAVQAPQQPRRETHLRRDVHEPRLPAQPRRQQVRRRRLAQLRRGGLQVLDELLPTGIVVPGVLEQVGAVVGDVGHMGRSRMLALELGHPLDKIAPLVRDDQARNAGPPRRPDQFRLDGRGVGFLHRHQGDELQVGQPTMASTFVEPTWMVWSSSQTQGTDVSSNRFRA